MHPSGWGLNPLALIGSYIPESAGLLSLAGWPGPQASPAFPHSSLPLPGYKEAGAGSPGPPQVWGGWG